MERTTGIDYEIPNDYENGTATNTNVIFCSKCGTINHIVLDWSGSIRGIIFCWCCGAEI